MPLTGLPQCGQAAASFETFPPQSGQVVSLALLWPLPVVFAAGAFSAGVFADCVPESQPSIANSSRTSGEILMLATFPR